MIMVCEFLCSGLTHVSFNSMLLKIIRYAYPTVSICFLAEKNHLNAVKNIVNKNFQKPIFWEPLPNAYNIPFHIKLIIKLIFKSDLVVLTSANSFLLISIKLLLLFKKKKAAQAVMHSNLNQIIGWRSPNPFARVLDFKSAFCLNLCKKKVQIIVLEKSIKHKLQKMLPSTLTNQVMVLEHPVPDVNIPPENIQLNSPVKIGFLGIASKDKGFSEFLKLANQLNKIAEFHVIGSTAPDIELLDLSALKSKPAENKLGAEEYIQHLNAMHFICLPYNKKYYELSASGILLDAIAFEKPIISYKFPLIADLEKHFGNLGYLCDTFNDMIGSIQIICHEMNEKKYRDQKNTLKIISKQRNTNALMYHYRYFTNQLIQK